MDTRIIKLLKVEIDHALGVQYGNNLETASKEEVADAVKEVLELAAKQFTNRLVMFDKNDFILPDNPTIMPYTVSSTEVIQLSPRRATIELTYSSEEAFGHYIPYVSRVFMDAWNPEGGVYKIVVFEPNQEVATTTLTYKDMQQAEMAMEMIEEAFQGSGKVEISSLSIAKRIAVSKANEAIELLKN